MTEMEQWQREQIRQFVPGDLPIVWVDDVARAILKAMRAQDAKTRAECQTIARNHKCLDYSEHCGDEIAHDIGGE